MEISTRPFQSTTFDFFFVGNLVQGACVISLSQGVFYQFVPGVCYQFIPGGVLSVCPRGYAITLSQGVCYHFIPGVCYQCIPRGVLSVYLRGCNQFIPGDVLSVYPRGCDISLSQGVYYLVCNKQSAAMAGSLETARTTRWLSSVFIPHSLLSGSVRE